MRDDKRFTVFLGDENDQSKIWFGDYNGTDSNLRWLDAKDDEIGWFSSLGSAKFGSFKLTLTSAYALFSIGTSFTYIPSADYTTFISNIISR